MPVRPGPPGEENPGLWPHAIPQSAGALRAQSPRMKGVCLSRCACARMCFLPHGWGGLYCVYNTPIRKHGKSRKISLAHEIEPVWWEERWILRPGASVWPRSVALGQALALWPHFPDSPCQALVPQALSFDSEHPRGRQGGTMPCPAELLFFGGPRSFLEADLPFRMTPGDSDHWRLPPFPSPVPSRPVVCMGVFGISCVRFCVVVYSHLASGFRVVP